jgi:hypothetical protein
MIYENRKDRSWKLRVLETVTTFLSCLHRHVQIASRPSKPHSVYDSYREISPGRRVEYNTHSNKCGGVECMDINSCAYHLPSWRDVKLLMETCESLKECKQRGKKTSSVVLGFESSVRLSVSSRGFGNLKEFEALVHI